MKRNFLGASLGVLITAALQGGFAQVTPSPEDDLKRASTLASQGQVEQAVLLMKTAAKRASDQGDKRTAAHILFEASQVLRQMGQYEDVINALRQAQPNAQGTDMEPIIHAFLDLGLVRLRVEQARDDTAYLNCLRILYTVEHELTNITVESSRLSAQSEELNERAFLFLEFLRRDLNSGYLGKPARELPLASQIFVISVIDNRSPEDFEQKPDAIRNAIDDIDKRGQYQAGPLRSIRSKSLAAFRHYWPICARTF